MGPSVNRRDWLRLGGAGGMTALLPGQLRGGEPAPDAGPARFRLGIVTYNIAATWDVPTILRICKGTGVSAVELRTTHKHGVEPSITAERRKEVREQFAQAGSEYERLQPQAAEANQRIGDIRQRLGQYEQAIAAYRNAADLYAKPAVAIGETTRIKSARTYNELARALQSIQRADEAREALAHALQVLTEATPALAGVCRDLTRWLAVQTDGVYQVDGSGFHAADGTLLVAEAT